MDIIYRAFDGKEFDCEDDCLKYETMINAKRFKSNIVGLGESGEEIGLSDGLEQFFQDSYFVFVKTQEAVDFINNMDLMIKSPYCEMEEYYYYDEGEDEWISINEKINELYGEIEELSQIKRKLYNLTKNCD